MLWMRNVYMGTFDLHGRILCVSEGLLSELLWMYIVDIETLDLHELILSVFEGFFESSIVITV